MSQFSLPVEPIDGYKVEWWTVDSYDTARVVHHHAIYHVNATWAEVYPDDLDKPGAPFVDDWQIFRESAFVGRNDGWSAPWTERWVRGVFFTRRAAIEKALDVARGDQDNYNKRLDASTKAIAQFERELANT